MYMTVFRGLTLYGGDFERYLDQLGMTSTYDTKTYCRQTLVGGNYGLLDTLTFLPNPDYYRYSYVCVYIPTSSIPFMWLYI